MNRYSRRNAGRMGARTALQVRVLVFLAMLTLLGAGTAGAQDVPATAPPAQAAGRDAATGQAAQRPEDLEPGVSTSAPPPAAAPRPQAAGTPPAASRPQTATAVPGAGPASPKSPAKAAGSGKAQDRIELDATQITGNRELPKVLVIVPWKRSELGDLIGKPVNSLVDEVLQPIDRDVFRRQNRYYRALQPDGAAKPGAAPEGPR